ncbi:uncharacterized protein sS8_0466 [Methylocaldum marinum]|uniref:Sialate O-acetylesterase domain-containing protein n=1 Tax=Methylocaldum marinum TaxID=1432792 RepID=A0A286P460_9GAMM|nr:sialate O-acetylesterase [Methylocaldum marinum]BBA32432.1 uncharacterized protein sS8_0466 [Methylocaldum marinum]
MTKAWLLRYLFLVSLASAAVAISWWSPVRKFVEPMAYGGPVVKGQVRQEIDCRVAMTGKTLVGLVFGQSNAANFGETRYRPRKAVYSFYAGRCYAADDPLPGAAAFGGSVWSRLGDKLVESGMFDSVIWISIGEGGSSISRWTVGGDLYDRLMGAVENARGHKLKITHAFWHQGESDRVAKTSEMDYRSMFLRMVEGLRSAGVDAPIYVAVATYCYGKESPDIQRAQRTLVNVERKIYSGPNTDELSSKDVRYDDCHFSDSGLRRHADAWFEVLKRSSG